MATLVKAEINGVDYQIGVDVGQGDISIEETFMRPSAEYPDGSFMRKVAGKVVVAIGHFATLYPDKPSLEWHGRMPYFFLNTADWPWERNLENK